MEKDWQNCKKHIRMLMKILMMKRRARKMKVMAKKKKAIIEFRFCFYFKCMVQAVK